MVRSLSRFAAAVAVILAGAPALAVTVEANSASALKICVERAAMSGPVECLISEPIEVRTSGASVTAAVELTLPTSNQFETVVRFAAPSGCIVWNHSGAEPSGVVDVLSIVAPSTVVAGSRIALDSPCVREQRSGEAGGGASTSVRAVRFSGAGAGLVHANYRGGARIDLRSAGASSDAVAGLGAAEAEARWGVDGGLMSWDTVAAMEALQGFEGLDARVPWARFWIDPYAGDDANPGTYTKPIRTIGEWKQRAGFGTWFTIKNAGRPRPMVISNQTFPLPGSETCVVGEVVTYDSAASTSRILDIDLAAGVFVADTLTGSPLAESDVITAGSTSGAGCAFTVGARVPSIWDGSTTVCNTAPGTACTVTGGCTRGGACTADCGTGPICVGIANASVMLETTPAGFAGKIVSIIDAEDPSMPPIVHSDLAGLSENDADDQGLFIARGSAAYGCLGIANIRADQLQNDFLSQHEEGCVKALNAYAVVWNDSGDTNNNVATTHNGTSGRGALHSVNGGGVAFRHANSGGAPVAPTGSSAMILVGQKSYVADLTNWTETNLTSSPIEAAGGTIALVGGEFRCENLVSSNPFGCGGAALTSSSGLLTFRAARSVIAGLNRSGVATLPVIRPTTSSTATARVELHRTTLSGNGAGWLLSPSAAGGIITIIGRGLILDAAERYFRDIQTDPARTVVDISGIYDDDGSNKWFVANAERTTRALAAAATASAGWQLMGDDFSVQTDATEINADGSQRCASGGECFSSYAEPIYMQLPQALTDYLPVPVRGYYERGLRSYGAR